MDLENKASFILQAIHSDAEALNYCSWPESTLWETSVCVVFCDANNLNEHMGFFIVMREELHVLSLERKSSKTVQIKLVVNLQ